MRWPTGSWTRITDHCAGVCAPTSSIGTCEPIFRRRPVPLVDIGGGAGNQSLPLARDGYEVTIVDPSREMLKRAELRLAAEPGDAAGRVRLVRASAEEAAGALGGRRFAGVLCHGVIMYVEDPRPLVAALAGLAEPGGLVSLVAKNAKALATRIEARTAQIPKLIVRGRFSSPAPSAPGQRLLPIMT
jgi:2-polyprenyl-3-methyl-5-hydroxy-6-metoxy-1,4-benzoquinol methylase